MLASLDRLTDRIARQVILLAMAACLCLAAIGFAAAALYYWLLAWMLQPQALGLVALVLLIVALVLALAAQRSSKRIVAKTAHSDLASGIPALAALASDAAGAAVKADPLGAMLGAGAVGFILESRPDLDHALVQQILRQFVR